MTKYSEWVIIPEDRKCDLPPNTKVQVMRINQGVETASKQAPVDVSCCLRHSLLTQQHQSWLAAYFAYRVVQEPVTEVRTYECGTLFFSGNASPMFCEYNSGCRVEGFTKGTATQTTRDGKPYRFVWEASE